MKTKGVEWIEREYEEIGLCGFAAKAELIVVGQQLGFADQRLVRWVRIVSETNVRSR